MPKILKWIGVLAAAALVAAGFLPWMVIESKDLLITGMDTTGTNYGKPALLHFVFGGLFLILSLIPRVWAKRGNLLVVALNLAWALRNFFMITACQGGECPVKKIGLFLTLLSSLIILVAALFPDMKMQVKKG